MAVSLPHFPPFDMYDEPHTTSQRWKQWYARFENFTIAFGINEDARKRALLLHYAGEAVQQTFEALSSTTAQDYKTTVDILTTYFSPKGNEDFEIFQFRQATQKKAESIDEYHARLRKLAITCNFHEKEKEIKSQIIQTCTSSALRRKALREANLTLEDLLKVGRLIEMSEKQAKDMEKNLAIGGNLGNNTADSAVNAIQMTNPRPRSQTPHREQLGRNGPQNAPRRTQNTPHRTHPNAMENGTSARGNFDKMNTRQCTNCGFWHDSSSTCPAGNRQCFSCGRNGHFSRCCRSTQRSEPRPRRDANREHQGRNISSIQKLETPTEEPDEEEVEGRYGLLFSTRPKPNSIAQPLIEVQVGGNKVLMVADTGASVNLIDDETLSRMERKQDVRPTKMKIFAYGSSTPLELKGSFEALTMVKGESEALTMVKGESTTAQFFVVRKSDNTFPVLGFETLKALKISPCAEIFTVKKQERTENFLAEYPDVFSGMGTMKGDSVRLHIDPSICPIAQPHRRVPFHLRSKLEEELKRLLDEDIIEPAKGPTPWVSPVVLIPKANDPEAVRLCVDMRAANAAIQRERHVMPTIEDVISDLNGATVFSKLDLSKGYHQLSLDPSSREITTFGTHCGLYRYKRLFFGVNSAAEVFQNRLESTIRDIKCAKNISDDILIYGRDTDEHDEALHSVLRRLRDCGLTLNASKCVFRVSEITFFGHVFSDKGISPDPRKVDAINEMMPPKNANEVRSLLGMANYCSKFIPHLATIIEPLRELTKKSKEWEWSEKQELAFGELKKRLVTDTKLSYFDPTKETALLVDASPVGLGAVLAQQERGETELTILAYASKSLSPCERRYSQLERETLAIVWGLEHFRLYIQGAPVTVYTDHKPLQAIFKNPRSRPSARVERWAVRLQSFRAEVIYRPGRENPADYLSRYCRETQHEEPGITDETEEAVLFAVRHAIPRALTREEILRASDADPAITLMRDYLTSGKWKVTRSERADFQEKQTLQTLFKLRHEFSMVDGLLLKADRIVIPSTLEDRVIDLAHEGHQGLVRTKQLLRTKVWFPNLNKKVESRILKCLSCQSTVKVRNAEPLIMSPLPKGPWEEVSADFYGPLSTGEYLLVIIDEYSRFPIVETVHSTGHKATTTALERVFGIFGIPKVLKSDNGPPYNGEQFRLFMSEMGAIHRRITPAWPQANGMAERFMPNLTKVIQSATVVGGSWRHELSAFLMNYRNTPHPSTGATPAEALFNRQLNTKLPSLTPEVTRPTKETEDLKAHDSAVKAKTKAYADARRNARHRRLSPGDLVLVKGKRKNKATPHYEPTSYRVDKVKGTMVTARRQDGKMITRNASFFKIIGAGTNGASLESPEDTGEDVDLIEHLANGQRQEAPSPAGRQPLRGLGARYNLRPVIIAPRRLGTGCPTLP